MQIKSNKLIVYITTISTLLSLTSSQTCADYSSLFPDFKCVDTPTTSITGIQYRSFMVTKTGGSEESLAVVVSDKKQAEIFSSNMTKAERKVTTMKAIYSKEDEKQMVFIFEVSGLTNVFTKIQEKDSFNQPSQILSLGKQLLQDFKDAGSLVTMADINSRNIFVDAANKPQFLFIGASSGSPSTVQEKAFALGLLMYTVSQKNEPFSGKLTELNQRVLTTPLPFNKETSQDTVDAITLCLSQPDSASSYEPVFDAFVRTLQQPTLNLLKTDQTYIPFNSSFTDSVSSVSSKEPLSFAMIYIYSIVLVVGIGFFFGLKKPLTEQQNRHPIIPLMQGLDAAENQVEAIHQMQQEANPNNQPVQNVGV